MILVSSGAAAKYCQVHTTVPATAAIVLLTVAIRSPRVWHCPVALCQGYVAYHSVKINTPSCAESIYHLFNQFFCELTKCAIVVWSI